MPDAHLSEKVPSAGAVMGSRRRPIRKPRRGLFVIAASIVLVVVGATAAFLASGRSPAQPPRLAASAPPFTIVYERPWRAVRGAVPGSFAVSRTLAHRGVVGPVILLESGLATLAAGQLRTSPTTSGGPRPTLRATTVRPTPQPMRSSQGIMVVSTPGRYPAGRSPRMSSQIARATPR